MSLNAFTSRFVENRAREVSARTPLQIEPGTSEGLVSTMSERSQLGLDEEHSFFEKLKQFVVLLLVGPLIGLVLFAAVGAVQPPWNAVVLHASQTLGPFWAMLLVFVWWRPAWLRSLYLWIEWKRLAPGFGCILHVDMHLNN